MGAHSLSIIVAAILIVAAVTITSLETVQSLVKEIELLEEDHTLPLSTCETEEVLLALTL
jgi:hypothetical protein